MNAPADTIFALSSGRLPAGIAVMRVSGPRANVAVETLAGKLPTPRRAVLRTLRDGDEPLDRAMLLWLPGPATATGEDIAELHLHGSLAVVRGVEAALGRIPGLRAAEAGEYSRRALLNGRMDLTGAEGLRDLLAAETATQRRAALALAGGAFGREIEGWRDALLDCAARIEAALDQGEEDEVAGVTLPMTALAALRDTIAGRLAAPSADRLRDGIRVVLAGPPNAGKSSLLNRLVDRDAAIVSDIAGTTRDVIEAFVDIAGIAFLFSDTAGLRETADPIERIGRDRATRAIAAADIVLWLGDDAPPPCTGPLLLLHPRADEAGRPPPDGGRIAISSVTGRGLDELRQRLIDHAVTLLPIPGEVALHHRHRALLGEIVDRLGDAVRQRDPLIVAEDVRSALMALHRLTGRADIEDVLDRLFATFCLGK